MVTRLRYVTLENGNMVSKEPIVASGDVLTVTLIPANLTYTIANAANGAVLDTGDAVSMQMLKIKAKKALRSRGAVFGDEVRSKAATSASAAIL
jgi:hypothetical protein